MIISATVVNPDATHAAFSLPHVGGLCLVLCKIISVMSDDVFVNAGWCTK